MTLEESIQLQKDISNPKITEEEAISLLIKKTGMNFAKARFRVRMSRGHIIFN